MLNVGGIGEGVNVDGTGVEAGEHPLNTTVSNAKTRKIDRIVFFMALISFLIRLCRVAPNGRRLAPHALCGVPARAGHFDRVSTSSTWQLSASLADKAARRRIRRLPRMLFRGPVHPIKIAGDHFSRKDMVMS